jgi:hypothetical protein
MLDGKVTDADVRVGRGAREVRCRLVGVPTEKGYCFFLSSLPPRIAPRSVTDLYRVRWEIKSDNKLDKSCLRLREIGARTGLAVRALVHGLREAPPPRAGTEREKPPIHAQSLARMVSSCAHSIARAFELAGGAHPLPGGVHGYGGGRGVPVAAAAQIVIAEIVTIRREQAHRHAPAGAAGSAPSGTS